MKRVRVKAIGHVQGVFFRASTRDEAQRLGVTGWARNAADGSVELELQGEDDDVEAMVDFCRRGPGRSLVESLTVNDVAPVQGEQSFVTR